MKSILAVLLCLLLTACAAPKLAYNNADTLVYWWLDGYVDFNLDQKGRAKDEIAAFHQWHRRVQLPAWVAMAKTLQAQALGDVTAAQLCSHWQQVQNAVPPTTTYLEPAVVWLATSLSASQIQSIEKKYAKTNQKWREEWMPKDKADLAKNMLKSYLERTDHLYGSLPDAQMDVLKEGIARSPFDAKLVYAERLRKQQDMLSTLRGIQAGKPSGDAAKEAMRGVLARDLRSPDEAYRAHADNHRQYNCALFAKLHNSTTPLQRRTLLENLQSYERDFAALQKP